MIGMDTARSPSYALYVREWKDVPARTLILQHGTAAHLVARRRATGWGLNLPPLELAGAFADPSPTATRRLIARSARDSLTLAWSSESQSGRATLLLTPLLGWAIVQSLVAPGSWPGRVLQGLWILLLVAPIGWWAARSHHPLTTLSLAATAIAGATAAASDLFGVAAVSPLDWSLMARALAGGFLLARTRIVRRHRGILPP